MNFTEKIDFYKGHVPKELLNRFGSPLYVYNEDILVDRIRNMKSLIEHPNFIVNYSLKANGNLALLQIMKKEGLHMDAMSPGEVAIEEKAGFSKDNIFYVSNNMTKEEMQFVIDKGFYISLDSLDQLDLYGSLSENSKVSIRVNTGIGAGHHKKVVTAGADTKFGITVSDLEEARKIAKKRNIQITGLNHHIGSLFLEAKEYLEGMTRLLEISKDFDDVTYIDFGGGFGVPYRRADNEKPLDFEKLRYEMNEIISKFLSKNKEKEYTFAIEPGRYIVAESGVLLGQVTSVKYNEDRKFIGSDLGFYANYRPVLYDAYHEIEIYSSEEEKEEATLVGNICESGDILAANRNLPKAAINDVIALLDAGAYGYSMSSNYNQRVRPAEVLIRSTGDVVLIRKREEINDLLKTLILLDE